MTNEMESGGRMGIDEINQENNKQHQRINIIKTESFLLSLYLNSVLPQNLYKQQYLGFG